MLVANSFDLWQQDAFFLAAKEVQQSADMSSLGMKTSNDTNELDIENGKLEKVTKKTIRGKGGFSLHNQALLASIAYCFSSCCMILVNKYVLSSYDFNAGTSLMLYRVTFLIISAFVKYNEFITAFYRLYFHLSHG